MKDLKDQTPFWLRAMERENERTVLRDFSSQLRWIKNRANRADLRRVLEAYAIGTKRHAVKST